MTRRDSDLPEETAPISTKGRMIAAARADLAQRQKDAPGSVSAFEARMGRLAAARKLEQQRLDHLVFGKPRPVERVTIAGKKKRRSKTSERPVRLEPGIEEAMQRREAYAGTAAGTPETREHARRTHSGALVQLHRNGTISDLQLEYAAQIASVYRSLEADVAVKVASLEARVDQSRRCMAGAEGIYRIRIHLAYGYWRETLPPPKRLVLDMVVGDTIGYSVAARIHRVHNRRAKRLLIEALDRWPRCVARAFSVVGDDVASAMNEGVAVAPVWREAPDCPTRAASHAGEAEAPAARTGQQDEALPDSDRGRTGTAQPAGIDPAFLDDRGLLREWPEIAAIIRARISGEDADA